MDFELRNWHQLRLEGKKITYSGLKGNTIAPGCEPILRILTNQSQLLLSFVVSEVHILALWGTLNLLNKRAHLISIFRFCPHPTYSRFFAYPT